MLASGPGLLLSPVSLAHQSAARQAGSRESIRSSVPSTIEDAVREQRTIPAVESNPPGFRTDGPAPYLEQPRAQSALRSQLAAIIEELEPELDRRRADEPLASFELHVLPHRLIARLAEVGISFSWVGAVGGQAPTVSKGRLLVIQWAGVETEIRGVAALRSAHPVRERVYRPEASSPEHWGWRLDDADGPVYTTAALVAEWLAVCTNCR
jgi:hypothetical protein